MENKEQKICFVISPIGKQGTDTYDNFKQVLDYIIRPAIESANMDIQVLRADDIDRPGSFIKDILEMLLKAYVVIADLTGQNPNVFYELGVRHSLSPRTILIAQKADDIPSDLKEYRYVIYDVSLKGAAEFRDRIRKYLTEISGDPSRPDSPVLDRIPGIAERDSESLQQENEALRAELETVRQKLVAVESSQQRKVLSRTESLDTRLSRVLKLLHLRRARLPLLRGFAINDPDNKKWDSVSTSRGSFELFVPNDDDSVLPTRLNYVSSPLIPDLGPIFADMRVIMSECERVKVPVRFILCGMDEWANDGPALQERFNKVLSFLHIGKQRRFTLEVWNSTKVEDLEKELGLLV